MVPDLDSDVGQGGPEWAPTSGEAWWLLIAALCCVAAVGFLVWGFWS